MNPFYTVTYGKNIGIWLPKDPEHPRMGFISDKYSYPIYIVKNSLYNKGSFGVYKPEYLFAIPLIRKHLILLSGIRLFTSQHDQQLLTTKIDYCSYLLASNGEVDLNDTNTETFDKAMKYTDIPDLISAMKEYHEKEAYYAT